MNISIAQMRVVQGDVKQNLNLAIDMINQAKKDESALVLFPELFLTGFDYPRLRELSFAMNQALDVLLKQSQDIAICGSLLENVDNKIYNTFYCLFDEKKIFKYSKVKLFDFTKENDYFASADKNQINTFELFGVMFGVGICYELRFPEILRKAALKGADVLLLSAIWPIERLHAWQTLVCARAIENQTFFAVCNANEACGKWTCAGHSSVYDPNGKLLECAYNQTGVKTVSIEPSLSKEIQREFPSLIEENV